MSINHHTRLSSKATWGLSFLLVLLVCCQPTAEQTPPLFEEIPSTTSGVSFSNDLVNTVDLNILNYLYFYNGGGIAVGDINNDSLVDVFFTGNLVPNRLYLNKGNFTFEDITEQAGIIHIEDSWSTGVTMADVNADGWLDIYVSQVGNFLDRKGRNQLFINQQDGTFQEEAKAYGLDQQGFGTQSAFFDFDQDGDLDMYQLNHSINPAGTVGDTIQRYEKDRFAGDRLLENVEGEFIEITEAAGIISSKLGYGLGITIEDFNGDHLPDIYVANDFHEDDYLYINQGRGKFREELRSMIGHTSKFSMGADAADINNDRHPDLISMDMKPFREDILKTAEPPEPYDIFQLKQSFGYYNQYPRNTLQLNQGGAYFVETAQLMGVDATDWSWSALFWDADLDGYKDLFITNGILRRPNDMDYLKFRSDPKVVRRLNGIPSKEDLAFIEKMPSVNLPNQAFQNLDGKSFAAKGKEWGFGAPHFSNGAVYADLDNDGDLDWVVNNIDEPASIYRNTTREISENTFLTIHLRDSSANTFGIGAKVYVKEANGSQYRYLSPSRGFQSAVSHALHFGLGKADSVEVIVIWPEGDLPVQEVGRVAANQKIWINRQAGNPIEHFSLEQEPTASVFSRIEDAEVFLHKENDYVDFNTEPLIPHMLSTEGPDIAVADVNRDGLEDFYICGAAGQGGQLFLQGRNGKFSASQSLWSDFAGQEEVACEFLDVEGDGDQDLLIGCGGNQFREGSPYNQERLYLNDGEGGFSLSSDRLPVLNTSSSTIAVADYNKDGDVDIFIGTRSVAGGYGLSPTSYLLENDGAGTFTLKEDVPFTKAGMITDASWNDMDGNGYPDLVLVGEWMPIQIWYNDGEAFTLKENELLTQKGWWNTVAIHDWDGDGDLDLIAGNLGLNSSMKASATEPCRLYVGDFDQNGQTDPILCYFRDGVSYPMATKDELEKQMPFIRKDFPSYQEFAGTTIEELIPADRLASAIVWETTTFAHVYAEQIEDGSFRITDLPWESQLAPVNAVVSIDLNGDGKEEVILGGNQFGFAPNLGRMDAGRGFIMEFDAIPKEWKISALSSGLMLPAEVRSLNIIHETPKGGQFFLLIGNNNEKIQLFVGQ